MNFRMPASGTAGSPNWLASPSFRRHRAQSPSVSAGESAAWHSTQWVVVVGMGPPRNEELAEKGYAEGSFNYDSKAEARAGATRPRGSGSREQIRGDDAN